MSKITITVCRYEPDELDGGLVELIEALQADLAKIPDECKADAQFDYDSGWDGPGSFAVTYEREQTDEEIRAQKQHAERRQTEAEAKERAELYRLKQKYETPTPTGPDGRP